MALRKLRQINYCKLYSGLTAKWQEKQLKNKVCFAIVLHLSLLVALVMSPACLCIE